jgi:hypothetical protein
VQLGSVDVDVVELPIVVVEVAPAGQGGVCRDRLPALVPDGTGAELPRSSSLARFSARSSATPLANFISLTEPFGPPSPLAPLSETTMTSVFSR